MDRSNGQPPMTALQNAYLLLRNAQAQLEALRQRAAEPIAIVGAGCRLPGGVHDLPSFWEALARGFDAICDVPPDRWDIEAFFDSTPGVPGKMSTRQAGFLEHVDGFDAEFFGISPREAAQLDPQQRLALEVAWEALENAGTPPARLAGANVGVFLGILGNDYAHVLTKDYEQIDAFTGIGASHAIAANRLSYALGLTGPSVALDTACSSSSVAVHLACQSLRLGETDVALAGGVNLIVSPEMSIALSQAQMLSPDGRCKTFDARADGYGRGEGCGIVVLKRLSRAEADGDTILAVVRGSAVNQDGRSNGITAPSGVAQQAVIRAALKSAGIGPQQVGFVETHGTGTPLGDPIEVEALLAAYEREHPTAAPLYLGALKTNIGHLEASAGIAGLLKAILALRHGRIPPNLHLQKRNPRLAPPEAPLHLPTELTPWPGEYEAPRFAAVSSFGFGGTNAHVILSEPPLGSRLDSSKRQFSGVSRISAAPRSPSEDGAATPACHVITLSARTLAALAKLAASYDEYLERHPNTALADFAYSVNTGRSALEHRAALVAEDVPALRTALRAVAAGELSPNVRTGTAASAGQQVAFLFSGQGAQYARMGLGLFESVPAFRDAFAQCDELMRPHLGVSLHEVLREDDAPEARLHQTAFTQPALFALEYALARTWMRWGVEPAVMMGHSVGEFAAACIAGVLRLEDAARLICRRAKLMQSLPSGGRMEAVFASEQDLRRRIRECIHVGEHEGEHDGEHEGEPEASASGSVGPQRSIDIAAINGPQACVVSGGEADLAGLLAMLDSRGVRHQPLRTSHAFHSSLLEPMLAALEETASGIEHLPPQIPLVANLTGEPADEETYSGGGYWRRHARQPVRFFDGMQRLAERGVQAFLEIGPGTTLLGMGRRCIEGGGDAAWLPSLRRDRDETSAVLDALAALFVGGADVAWKEFYQQPRPRLMDLPTYPFQRQRYWYQGDGSTDGVRLGGSTAAEATGHPLLGARLKLPLAEQVFESQLRAGSNALPAGHAVHGRSIVPESAYLEIALAAAHCVAADRDWHLADVAFPGRVAIERGKARSVQTVLFSENSRQRFRIVAPIENTSDSEFTTLAEGSLIAKDPALPDANEHKPGESNGVSHPVGDPVSLREMFEEQGIQLADAYLCLDAVHRNGAAASAQVRQPAGAVEDSLNTVPSLVQSGLYLLVATCLDTVGGRSCYLPASIGRMKVARPGGAIVRAEALRTNATIREITGDVRFYDAEGRLVLEMTGVTLRRTSRRDMLRALGEPAPQWLYTLNWQPQLLPPVQEVSQSTAGHWLVVGERSGFARQLAEQLETRGQDCAVLPADVTFEDVVDAIKNASADGMKIAGVVHLASLDVPAALDDASLELARQRGWGGALDAVRAVSESNPSRPPRVYLVTRGAAAVSEQAGDHGGPAISVAQAPLWGFGRVVAVEHPELECTRIDLAAGDAAEASRLANELFSKSNEDQVAYRAGGRFVARLTPMDAKTPAEDAQSTALDKIGAAGDQAGSYLITGGLGALGLEFARHLAELGARHLVLTSRSAPREAAQQALEDLTAQGVEVRTIQADVGIREDVERLLSEIAADLPPLRGVIHAAGVLDDGVIRDQTRARFDGVLRPKLDGARHLDELTRNLELDFFVLFSSAAALVGSPGQANYAAANAALDALAFQRRREGLPAVAIDWGSWADVGMAARLDEAVRNRQQASGVGTIPVAEGLEIFDELLAVDRPQVGVLPIDWAKFLATLPAGAAPRWLADIAAGVKQDAGRGPSPLRQALDGAAPAERPEVLQSFLSEQAARVLGKPDETPDPKLPLNELGFDSLMGVEFCNALSRGLDERLNPTILFEYSTIASLSGYIYREVLHLEEQAADDSAESEEELPDDSLAEIEGLSEAELDQLVAAEIAKLDRQPWES